MKHQTINTTNYKITVVGTGYVGLANAVLLAQHNEVVALDIDDHKVNLINQNISPIEDVDISEFLSKKKLFLRATQDKADAYQNADFVIIATPTDYNEQTNQFDMSSVESAINDALTLNPKAFIVIKSTIPLGYTEKLKKTLQVDNIVFSPEFLREGKALHDNLYPSRIVIGGGKSPCSAVLRFAQLLQQGAVKHGIPLIFTGNTEAEAIKLFANSYLAMRVAYFNELDSYAEFYGLDTKSIIAGVGLDERIGTHYNNPSFGFGGYCFPKDTKQLKASFSEIPHNLISAIVSSNETRKRFVAQQILQTNAQTIGIYRLVMKQGSNNFRSSAILQIMDELKTAGKNLIIYEPEIDGDEFHGIPIQNNLELFKSKSELIVANRLSDELLDVSDKVYSRDFFQSDV